MINYLEKYNKLPKDLKDKISAPHVMNAMHELEEKYGVSLAALVMRVMVKDLHVDEVQNYLVYNLEMQGAKAAELVLELKRRIFSEIANYLDYISNSGNDDTAKAEKEEYEARFGLSNLSAANSNEQRKGAGGANFYFSIEDEDEVRRQAKDFSDLDRREQIALQVEGKIDQIIGEINVIFSSEDMIRRLRQILKTYLRGVRDKIDTKQALERGVAYGGLGLEDEIADDILKVVDVINIDEMNSVGKVQKAKRFLLPEDMAVGKSPAEGKGNASMQDAAYDFSKLIEKRKAGEQAKSADGLPQLRFDSEDVSGGLVIDDVEEEESIGEKQDESLGFEMKSEEVEEEDASIEIKDEPSEERQRMIQEKEKALVLDLSGAGDLEEKKALGRKELASRMPQAVPVAKAAEEKQEDEAEEEISFHPGMMAKARSKAPISEEFSALNKPVANLSGKVKMEDIKKVAKLGGPLEEISAMSLTDFRRMSKSPVEAAAKVMGMFNLLEQEGFNKRMAGLKAWRQSPINKLYLAIGQESLIQKKDIKKIIEARKKENQEYLSPEEFDAIMELNKKLRY